MENARRRLQMAAKRGVTAMSLGMRPAPRAGVQAVLTAAPARAVFLDSPELSRFLPPALPLVLTPFQFALAHPWRACNAARCCELPRPPLSGSMGQTREA